MGSILSVPFTYFQLNSQEEKLMLKLKRAENKEQVIRAFLELRYKIERMEELGAKEIGVSVQNSAKISSIKKFFECADDLGYGRLKESASEVFNDNGKLAIYYCRIYDFVTRRIHCFFDDDEITEDGISETDIKLYFREEELVKLALCLEKVDF